MAKARKVKAAGKQKPARKPVTHRKKRTAVHKFSRRDEPKPEPRPPPAPEPKAAEPKAGLAKGAARLAALAAATEEAEPEVVIRKPAPKGGVAWEDYDDDDGVAPSPAPPRPAAPTAPAAVPMAAPPAPAPGDGIQVVAKGPSKLSLEDLELLRAAIKVKGAGTVVEGINLDELKWDGDGLLPVVAQDRRTGAVVHLGHMNKETLEQSLRSKQMTYWDRTRQKARAMGEESGHAQRLARMLVDCDKDALLAVVDQEGTACHRDTGTCWHDGRALPIASFLGELDRRVAEAAKDPQAEPRAAELLKQPVEALRGFVDGANQLTRAIQGRSEVKSLESPAADVLWALLVACRTKGVGLDRIVTELFARHMAAQMQGKA